MGFGQPGFTVLFQDLGAAHPSSGPVQRGCPHRGVCLLVVWPSPSSCPLLPFALQGAFWGLMAGLALGLARMGLELAHPTPRCGVPDRRPWLLADLHYLHFAALLCATAGAVVVGGSLMTPPPPSDRVSRARGHPGPRAP